MSHNEIVTCSVTRITGAHMWRNRCHSWPKKSYLWHQFGHMCAAVTWVTVHVTILHVIYWRGYFTVDSIFYSILSDDTCWVRIYVNGIYSATTVDTAWWLVICEFWLLLSHWWASFKWYWWLHKCVLWRLQLYTLDWRPRFNDAEAGGVTKDQTVVSILGQVLGIHVLDFLIVPKSIFSNDKAPIQPFFPRPICLSFWAAVALFEPVADTYASPSSRREIWDSSSQ